MSFKKQRYQIIRKAIPLDVANFVHDYFLLKKNVQRTLKSTKYISEFNQDWGKTGDDQCPTSYSHYGDLAMETILDILTPKLSELTKICLSPTYSYARIYERGAYLEKHKDRYSCEVSSTLNLGCVQVFLHYNDTSNKKWEENKYDGRPHLGLPVDFKNVKIDVKSK